MIFYKVFVIDADDNDCVYKTNKIIFERNFIELVDAELYLGAVGKFGEPHSVIFPWHRVLQIDKLGD